MPTSTKRFYIFQDEYEIKFGLPITSRNEDTSIFGAVIVASANVAAVNVTLTSTLRAKKLLTIIDIRKDPFLAKISETTWWVSIQWSSNSNKILRWKALAQKSQ